MAGFVTLTGRWIGRYEYRTGGSPVAFEAELIEADGSLSGQIVEPNTFLQGAGTSLTANIEGYRQGKLVRFVKRYQYFRRQACPDYVGQADARLCRIEGQWHFVTDPAQSGRFVMMRQPLAEARAERQMMVETQ